MKIAHLRKAVSPGKVLQGDRKQAGSEDELNRGNNRAAASFWPQKTIREGMINETMKAVKQVIYELNDNSI